MKKGRREMAVSFMSSTLLEWKVHNKAEFNKIFLEVNGDDGIEDKNGYKRNSFLLVG